MNRVLCIKDNNRYIIETINKTTTQRLKYVILLKYFKYLLIKILIIFFF